MVQNDYTLREVRESYFGVRARLATLDTLARYILSYAANEIRRKLAIYKPLWMPLAAGPFSPFFSSCLDAEGNG